MGIPVFRFVVCGLYRVLSLVLAGTRSSDELENGGPLLFFPFDEFVLVLRVAVVISSFPGDNDTGPIGAFRFDGKYLRSSVG